MSCNTNFHDFKKSVTGLYLYNILLISKS